MKQEETDKFGTIAILGEINVGKSTLLNKMIDKDISIVTHKANTTREQVKGIKSDGDTQIVIIDTPGLASSVARISRSFLSQVWDAVMGANFILIVVDSSKPVSQTLYNLFDELKASTEKIPNAVLILNKIDRCSKVDLLLKSKKINDYFPFQKTFMISSLKGYGVKDLMSWVFRNVPKKSWAYPLEKKHDMSMEKFLNEKTRETILLRVHQEVPYNLEVDTHEIKELHDGSIRVGQFIKVQNARHRAIIIGKLGQTIKAISSRARQEIGKVLNKKVHLFLDVKLAKNKNLSVNSIEESI